MNNGVGFFKMKVLARDQIDRNARRRDQNEFRERREKARIIVLQLEELHHNVTYDRRNDSR